MREETKGQKICENLSHLCHLCSINIEGDAVTFCNRIQIKPVTIFEVTN
jgi:hypothetical protein